MRENLLQKGDVIQLEKGMKILTKIPKKFMKTECNRCSSACFGIITIGSILTNPKKEEETFDTSCFAGKYDVYYANFEKGNVDTDGGYCVYCNKVDDPKTKIYFYQTGTSKALIRNLLPL